MTFDIKETFLAAGIPATKKQLDQFSQLLDIFLQKNAVINLSAIRDEVGVVQKHFIDSLALLPYLPQSGRVLDL